MARLEFAFNSAPSAVTGLSPFEGIYGFLPSTFPCTWEPSDIPAVDTFVERARINWLISTDAIIDARFRAAMAANRGLRDDPSTLKVGSKAYLSTKNLTLPGYLSSKFTPRFLGPFEITDYKESSSTYTLRLPPHLQGIHPNFHVELLRPHYPNDDARFPLRQPPPPPAEVDTPNARTVERILLHRHRPRIGRQFFVRWLGLGAQEDEWVKEAVLQQHSAETLRTYLAQNGGAYLGNARKGRRVARK